MTHIAMLLTNPYRPDPRVQKEAQSLTRAGYRVTVICWDRQGEFPAHDTDGPVEIRRLTVRSGYGVGSRQMLFLPQFWWRALGELRRLQPNIIHCHDLDTTPPGYLFTKLHRLPWIFDAHEAYPEATIELNVPKIIYRILVLLEKFMTPRATRVITVGNLIAKRFKNLGGRVSVVGNYQPLRPVESASPVVTRTDLGLADDNFVVAYIGGLNRSRAILPLIKASALVEGVTVLLLGDGPQRAAIEQELPHCPRVRYLGHVPQSHVPDYTRLADALYYGLQSDDLNNHYSSPNALFNALMAGRPLVTTNIGEVAQIVSAEQCGVTIDAPTPSKIAAAIEHLRDSRRRQTMGRNARRAAETTYNWAAAEAELLRVYRQICSAPPVPEAA